MKVVTFANQKGGSGKSTLTLLAATTLATDFKARVLVVDADPQQSLVQTREKRDALIKEEGEEYLYPIVSKRPEEIIAYLDSQVPHYDICFIDQRGSSDTKAALEVIGVCDMLVVPFSYSDFHVLAAEDFINALLRIQKQFGEDTFSCYSLHNEYSPSTRGDKELAEYLGKLPIPRFDTVISDRTCYKRPSSLYSFLNSAYRRVNNIPAPVAREVHAFAAEIVTKLNLVPQSN